MKRLVVISLGQYTAEAIQEQLRRLLADQLKIDAYYLNALPPSNLRADLIIYTSSFTYIKLHEYVKSGIPYRIARRSINYHEIGPLFQLAPHKKALLVNDSQESAHQTIRLLQIIGLGHIDYFPYYPGVKEYPQVDVAITPGEMQLVPSGMKRVINIHTRLVDMTSIMDIINFFGLSKECSDTISARYISDIIELMRKAANDIKKLESSLYRRQAKDSNIARYHFDDIAGKSQNLAEAIKLAKKMAKADAPILIHGESGTGKELFAQSIHNESSRRNGPFVAVNFAAMTEQLLESELFGYEEGSFTGAKRGGAPGLFEAANKGTLFLDEIGDAPLSFQVKLLRVLQEKQIRRVGSIKVIPIDVRVIAATNHDLKEHIKRKIFREDLYYRLNVLPLTLPALSERQGDVLPLCYVMYNDLSMRYITAEVYFSQIAKCLNEYNWPGNVRELQNVVEYLISICPGDIPKVSDLPQDLKERLLVQTNRLDLKEKIYQTIKKHNEKHEPVGRRSLASELLVSENKIRKELELLRNEGKIKITVGKYALQVC